MSRPAFLREVNAFRETLHHAGDADLVDHLGELAGARRAEQLAHARVGGDHLLGATVGLGVAAAHHGEHAVLRARLSARYRRIDEVKAALLRRFIQFARDLRGRGGVIDEYRVLAHFRERGARDRPHVIVVADAHHHEVLACGSFLRRLGDLAAEFLGPGFGLGGVAVVDRDLVAALVLQVPGHRVAHHAQTQKRDLRHCSSP